MPKSESGEDESKQPTETFFQAIKHYFEALDRDFFRRLHSVRFLIEVGTLLAILWYAHEAHQQNILLGANNRPFVYENGVKAVERTPEGIPSKVQVRFKNFGKSVAISAGMFGHIVVQAAGQPEPTDPNCKLGGWGHLPTNAGGTTIPEDIVLEPEFAPLPNQNLSDVNSGDILYVVGCAYYFGLDKTKTYFSDLCVTWAPKAPQDFPSCHDPYRNYAY